MTRQFIAVVFGIQYTESHSYPSCFGGHGCVREYPVRNVDYIVLTNTLMNIHTIISGKQYHAHTYPLFKEYKILPYTSHIQYLKLLFMHSVVYKYSPKSFANTWENNDVQEQPHNLRNQNHFQIPFPRIEMFKKSPLYHYPLSGITSTITDSELTRQHFALLLKGIY
jgi:hypothetical protein